jgi:uncharacterized protein (DUF2062 family)
LQSTDTHTVHKQIICGIITSWAGAIMRKKCLKMLQEKFEQKKKKRKVEKYNYTNVPGREMTYNY